jgi:AcrR family transcriptional regulator
MATPPKGNDRRVQRTRETIRLAFIDVIREKGLEGASVREITERANISRGAFYAHYADKYALIETFAREEFQKRVNDLPIPSLSRQTLPILIQSVLLYFQLMYQGHRLSPQIAPLLERAIHEELHAYLLRQLGRAPDAQTQAQLLGWAIFGAALQWSALPQKTSAAQKAQEVMGALTHLSQFTGG